MKQLFTTTRNVVTAGVVRPWLLAVVLFAALGAIYACGSDDTTGPGGGGGNKELNSGDFGPGGTYSHTFAAAGTFHYHCIHHSPMTGTVVVSAASVDSLKSVSIVSNTSPFPGATVKPGGRVTWTNNTGSVHTVTSN